MCEMCTMEKRELEIFNAMGFLTQKLIFLTKEKCSLSSEGPDSWSLRTIDEVDAERMEALSQLEALKIKIKKLWKCNS